MSKKTPLYDVNQSAALLAALLLAAIEEKIVDKHKAEALTEQKNKHGRRNKKRGGDQGHISERANEQTR